MSREVITVTGPIAPEELGVTSMHEHALADGTSYAWPNARPTSSGSPSSARSAARSRSIARTCSSTTPRWSRDELAEFREAGGQAIVDMSTPGLRVDVSALPSISERSGVRIVTGTGMYIDRSRPDWFADASIDELADWMVGEIEEGIDDTGVRAGQIGEIGIEKLDDGDQRLLRAAVRAAERTGVSISIHPGFEDGCDGRAIADVMDDEGVRPERVVIGHGDAFLVETKVARLVDDPDSWGLRLDYHRELLSRGYNLSIDCFGHDWRREDEDWMIENDWQRLAGLVALIREGFADQLVVGCDVFMRTLHRRAGGFGYRYLLDWVLPQTAGARSRRRDDRQAHGHEPGADPLPRGTGMKGRPHTLPSRTDVVVIGGGVVGAATARAIARRGGKVALLEKGSLTTAQGSSRGTARIIAPAPYPDSEYLEMALRALEEWRSLDESLLTMTGALYAGDGIEAFVPTWADAGIEIERLTSAEVERRFGVAALEPEPILFQPAGRGDPSRPRPGGAASLSGGRRRCRPPARASDLDRAGRRRCEAADDAADLALSPGDRHRGSVDEGALRAARDRAAADGHQPVGRLLRPRRACRPSTPAVMEFDGDEPYALVDPGHGLKAALHARGPETSPGGRWELIDTEALERVTEPGPKRGSPASARSSTPRPVSTPTPRTSDSSPSATAR